MTAGACRLSRLEASAERQRLRTIESIGAAIGPELALRIVCGNRRADQKRQRIIFIAIAAAESDKDVLFVAVTVGAGVERLAWRSTARRICLEASPWLERRVRAPCVNQ